jgi:methionyl aminopeptidase
MLGFQELPMDEQTFEHYEKAGKIAQEVVAFARGFIKRGMKLVEIADAVEGKIKELGGACAFPINLSLNEVAAHYTPSSDDETIAEGLLKVDIGVVVEGYIADTAFSLDLSESGEEFSEMIKLNVDALENTIGVLGGDSTVRDIGRAISATIHSYNREHGTSFSIIRNLSGHSLGENLIHAGLTISNYENDNTTPLSDMAFAIEPFLTTGKGEIFEGKPSEIFKLSGAGNVRDSGAREVLKFIKENYKTRPFCKRWLVNEGFKKAGFILETMVKNGILHNFPVLVEKDRKPVSQAEHTIMIVGGMVEVSTR